MTVKGRLVPENSSVIVAAPAAAARKNSPIWETSCPAIAGGQGSAQVRRQGHEEALSRFIKSARSMRQLRQPDVALVGIDDASGRHASRCQKMDEVQAVVGVQFDIGDQEVNRSHALQFAARGLEIIVRGHLGDHPGCTLQQDASAPVGFHEYDTKGERLENGQPENANN
jgi:hypothetical protein